MKFLAAITVTSAEGTQTFAVEADSLGEAVKKFKDTGYEKELVETDVEVLDLDFETVTESEVWQEVQG